MCVEQPPTVHSKPAKPSKWGALLLSSAIAITAMATISSVQAAGLGDLFSSDQSSSQSKFLPVDKAFQVATSSKETAKGVQFTITFDITPEHYVYKDRIKLDLPAGVSATALKFSQPAQSIDDPQFGRVPVFDQSRVTATTVLTSSKAITNSALGVTWQGCAKAGLCYPPEKINTTVSIAAPKAADKKGDKAADKAADKANLQTAKTEAATDNKADKSAGKLNSKAANQDNSNPQTTANPNSNQNAIDPKSAAALAAANPLNPLENKADLTSETSLSESEGNSDNVIDDTANENENADLLADDAAESEAGMATTGADSEAHFNNSAAQNSPTAQADSLVDSDPFGLAAHPWLALLLLFLAGLGLAFTPCVLPMLPIVANIVARQQNPTVRKSVMLTSSYALGVAIAYGILGAVIAIFGESLGIIGWLQNPVILISFAIVFVILALYMLEVVTIRLPLALSTKLQRASQIGDSKLGSSGGSFIAGFLSALVVSPCVSAPLFGALIAVSTIGSVPLGFAALFMLGLGLSAPLILIGATQGSIMPKAGEWMNWVKQGFALLLFAVALLLIERVFVTPVMMLIWALWFMVVAVWSWRWLGRGRMLTQALAMVLGLWSACLIVGAALGNHDSLRPLANLNQAAVTSASPALLANSADKTITTLNELDAITQSSPNVIVDLTADWCVECRIMDKNLFQNRPMQMQNWQLVRLDITETTADSKAILARYQLFGPPTLLYYQNGELVKKQVGEVKRNEFESALNELNAR